MYYYVLEEYRVSNELLTEDIYVRHLPSNSCSDTLLKNVEQNLQATVQRVESYVRVLEDKVEESSKKK